MPEHPCTYDADCRIAEILQSKIGAFDPEWPQEARKAWWEVYHELLAETMKLHRSKQHAALAWHEAEANRLRSILYPSDDEEVTA